MLPTTIYWKRFVGSSLRKSWLVAGGNASRRDKTCGWVLDSMNQINRDVLMDSHFQENLTNCGYEVEDYLDRKEDHETRRAEQKIGRGESHSF